MASASASVRIANASSTGIFRKKSLPIPAIFTALSIDEWVCSSSYTTNFSPENPRWFTANLECCSRAVKMLHSVADDAVS
ncbi:MAG: hypothetical protein R3C26_04865 [Calditrichia bacterium]